MNRSQKKILLIGTVVLLLVINISALSTMFYQNKIRNQRITEAENLREEVRIRGMHRYIREELNLTDAQFEEFQTINRSNMIKAHDIASELEKKRHEMISELAKINPNINKLDDIALEIGDLHYKLKKQTITHFMELKMICNEEQQEVLQQIFFKMLGDQDQNGANRRHHDRRRNRYKNRPQLNN